ncbi:WecB/TagA/CpsF family glycosyltransferase [Gymnodinialimonas sp. 2305UL16-5]|uniref:WecB/TagA/CpsF family glycosyltransferase n=1 Tax=Gymnodinialimonas mytili TaxID=3126503 RepID=UPI00309F87BB
MIWSPETDDPHRSHGLPPVQVTVPTREDLLQDLGARLERGQGFSIATLNLDHVVKLRRDPAFRRAYSSHSHVTADGRPVVWLTRLSGGDARLITGSDLIAPLAALCAKTNTPVAMVGATAQVLKTSAQRLEAQYPGLRVLAQVAPPMGFIPDSADADAVIDEVAASGARVCFLALGAPKQEIFAAHAAARLPNMGFVSIGAGLDFIAGTQVRAPRIMRALAMEWVWRLTTNPKRLAARYTACLAILPRLLMRALSERWARQAKKDPA